MVKKLPFIEVGKLRSFYESLIEDDLQWHWDEEDRTIELIEETDWLIQFDNQLPIKITNGIFIKAGEFHRLIKGSGHLKILVHKHDS